MLRVTLPGWNCSKEAAAQETNRNRRSITIYFQNESFKSELNETKKKLFTTWWKKVQYTHSSGWTGFLSHDVRWWCCYLFTLRSKSRHCSLLWWSQSLFFKSKLNGVICPIHTALLLYIFIKRHNACIIPILALFWSKKCSRRRPQRDETIIARLRFFFPLLCKVLQEKILKNAVSMSKCFRQLSEVNQLQSEWIMEKKNCFIAWGQNKN